MTEPRPFLGDVFKWHESVEQTLMDAMSRSDARGDSEYQRSVVLDATLELAVLIESSAERPKC